MINSQNLSYWLLKTEPKTWSWKDQKKNHITQWDGVRNFQARSFMKKMKINDLCFFYHTGNEKKIVGIVKVIKSYYLADDQNFGLIDVKTFCSIKNPISLAYIKKDKNLQHLLLIKQSRLSVVPIDYNSFLYICNIANVYFKNQY